jgi:hypothetical protein
MPAAILKPLAASELVRLIPSSLKPIPAARVAEAVTVGPAPRLGS